MKRRAPGRFDLLFYCRDSSEGLLKKRPKQETRRRKMLNKVLKLPPCPWARQRGWSGDDDALAGVITHCIGGVKLLWRSS
jgi:hypothetical protein